MTNFEGQGMGLERLEWRHRLPCAKVCCSRRHALNNFIDWEAFWMTKSSLPWGNEHEKRSMQLSSKTQSEITSAAREWHSSTMSRTCCYWKLSAIRSLCLIWVSFFNSSPDRWILSPQFAVSVIRSERQICFHIQGILKFIFGTSTSHLKQLDVCQNNNCSCYDLKSSSGNHHFQVEYFRYLVTVVVAPLPALIDQNHVLNLKMAQNIWNAFAAFPKGTRPCDYKPARNKFKQTMQTELPDRNPHFARGISFQHVHVVIDRDFHLKLPTPGTTLKLHVCLQLFAYLLGHPKETSSNKNGKKGKQTCQTCHGNGIAECTIVQ